MTHAFHIRHPYSVEFIKKIGLDPESVIDINIEMGIDKLAVVEVKFLMDTDSMGGITELNKKYILKLEEIE